MSTRRLRRAAASTLVVEAEGSAGKQRARPAHLARLLALGPLACVLLQACRSPDELVQSTWSLVDTGQDQTYPGDSATHPAGQDADYAGNAFSYTVSGDGLSVYDNHTRLTWTREILEDPTHTGDAYRFTFQEALDFAVVLNDRAYGGITTWRLPTIKELYSLMDFRGSSDDLRPYVLTVDPETGADLFEFRWGDADGDGTPDGDGDPATADGDEWTDLNGDGDADMDEWIDRRPIDSQYWTMAKYVGLTFSDDETVFGVNFADGRIKGYAIDTGSDGSPPDVEHAFVRYVSGPIYGFNQFVDNGDQTITDQSSGLMWTSGVLVDYEWAEALEYAESLTLAGHDDWRLPDAKELQSIIDYSRSPNASDPSRAGPALDPVFSVSKQLDTVIGAGRYPHCWTSTTHLERNPPQPPPGWTDDDKGAVYLALGIAYGWDSTYGWVDVHGAGAQRSDPKHGDPTEFPPGCSGTPPCGSFGPQNDLIGIRNGVICVRDAR